MHRVDIDAPMQIGCSNCIGLRNTWCCNWIGDKRIIKRCAWHPSITHAASSKQVCISAYTDALVITSIHCGQGIYGHVNRIELRAATASY